MKKIFETSPAFSLVELIVVISIIAVLSVGAYVGFRGTGDTLLAREAAGIVQDTVKITEMEILKDDYEKSTIYFLEDYLVIISEPEGKSLELTLDNSCTDGHNISFSSDGNLTKKDSNGNLIESKSVSSGESECVAFKNSEQIGWNYQLSSAGEVSDVIRFLHFNVDREKETNIKITSNEGKYMSIEAPYSKKTLSVSPINLTVSAGEATENITIQ